MKGHYHNRCPSANSMVAYYLLNFDVCMLTVDIIPHSLILLNACSTHTCTNNCTILSSLVKCRPSDAVTLLTNGVPSAFVEK